MVYCAYPPLCHERYHVYVLCTCAAPFATSDAPCPLVASHRNCAFSQRRPDVTPATVGDKDMESQEVTEGAVDCETEDLPLTAEEEVLIDLILERL